jgi:predicted Zn-dependent protease with MMP-like domain
MPSYKTLEKVAAAEIQRLSATLPVGVREALAELPVHLQALPDADVIEELGENILGLFSGETVEERGETLLPSPPQIHLYLENLWDEADADLPTFRQEVRITFLHELGHYLGWDEDEMERQGLD